MKRLVLLNALFILSAFGLLNAQMIEDFESIPMNIMLGGADDSSMMTVMENPVIGTIDSSMQVVNFLRDKDGVPWGGFWGILNDSIDLTNNKYIHVKVWKPRISPLHFKVGNGPDGDLEIESMNPQTLTNEWEDIVFDFSSKTGKYKLVSFMPDFSDPVNLTDDITIYFDEIYINNDPTPNSTPVYMIEDYEHITFNMMLNDPQTDSSKMWQVPNPVPGGINMSPYVCEFLRDKDGVLWDGFYSFLMDSIDVTTNKYVHAMVWKPRISPLHFKIGNGPDGDLEIPNMNDQTLTNDWEDIVFDFSTKTGKYDLVSFMPDFPSDSVGLTDDIIIYFDNIRLSDSPYPQVPVTFTVDMTNAENFNPDSSSVYLSGDYWGWPMPGSDPDVQLMPSDTNAMVYTITMNMDISGGAVFYKYFFVMNGTSSWDNGEWDGDPNRQAVISGETVINDVWAAKPVTISFNVDMMNADPFDPSTDDVYIAGDLANGWAMPGTIPYYKMNPPENTDTTMNYWINLTLQPGDYNYKYFRVIDGEASWDNGEWTGDPNRMITADTTKTIYDVWGSPAGIPDNQAISFAIYPNPVNDVLTVQNVKDAQKIEIFNVVGEMVKTIEKVSTEAIRINTADLKKGVYMIAVFTDKGVESTKLLKN